MDQTITNWINRAVSWWPFAGGNPSGNGTAARPVFTDILELIAGIAASYVEAPKNTMWVDKQGPQCNAFVKQVLDDAGVQAPLSLGSRFKDSFPRIAHYLGLSKAKYPASAGDWAYPHDTMTCWHNIAPYQSVIAGNVLPPFLSKPGDVIAEAINYSDATGHVGIVIGFRQTVSADSAAWCVSPGTPAEIIDITDYGFRPDGWVSPQTYEDHGQMVPCSTVGWASKATVKRFVCY